ncbi:uncharacterized protein LOC133315034 [Gastrolobium bilobum]|uniref:uncharacterized protein LOC133315034 n=1 Tax=Gastrolobium bilobum TaxID=150636 RepID=UPI002AAF2D1D|nr:uncharacterized protein LOC133315034 [Gastrolobium bilobum]
MTSVPQFGGWDQKAPGATDYSMVFTQARVNKKHQKTDLTEIKHNSLGNERDFVNAKHAHHAHGHHGHHGHGHAHAHVDAHAHEDPVVVGKKRILTYINCCIRP